MYEGVGCVVGVGHTPHRHDGGGVGWSGCRMATYGTKLHAYTETEFPLFLSLVLVVVLSVRPTPYGKVG